MFNKDLFSRKLSLINDTYNSMTDFAKNANFDRTYISKYINKKLNNPPTPKILEKIALASNNITSYEELMQICGYINLLNFDNGKIYADSNKTNPYQIFTETYIEDISLNDKELKAYDEISEIIANELKIGEIFNINYIEKNTNLYYHKLTSQGKEKVLNLIKQSIEYIINLQYSLEKYKNIIFKIPILKTIKANYDWLSKENVIGNITDKDTIKNYEKNINEYFALKVTGESMLPLLDDGDIVIFHKQDNIETGQTAIIIIEDDEAIIRKIIKTSEGIELHAMNPYYPIRRFTFAEMEKKSIKIVGRVKEANIKKAFE